MADTQHVSSNGYPGYDAAPGAELQCTMWARGQTFGTAANPFGTAVTDPNTDLRLASFAMNTIDWETSMVFDVWMTNNAIYPYYERLNLTGSATYEAFSSIFPPVWRTPGDQSKVTVAYNRSAGIVRWLVDDQEVARVSNLGFPAPGTTTIINHGGTPEAAAPRQLNCGMALFSHCSTRAFRPRGRVSSISHRRTPSRRVSSVARICSGRAQRCASAASRSTAQTDSRTAASGRRLPAGSSDIVPATRASRRRGRAWPHRGRGRPAPA